MLLDFLRYYRLTLEMKCSGLDAEQLARRSVPPSTMSLLGLLGDFAEEERRLRRVTAAEDVPWLYRTAEGREADWDGAVADPVVFEEAWRQWRAEAELLGERVVGSTSSSRAPDPNPQPRAGALALTLSTQPPRPVPVPGDWAAAAAAAAASARPSPGVPSPHARVPASAP